MFNGLNNSKIRFPDEDADVLIFIRSSKPGFLAKAHISYRSYPPLERDGNDASTFIYLFIAVGFSQRKKVKNELALAEPNLSVIN